MSHWNFEGIERRALAESLRRPEVVRVYVNRNACMLCMRQGVMECGLCEMCYATLNGKELDLAVEWNSGFRP